ncbi:MAG TPA: hypothetical protein VGK74_06550 [Symbiobacteriaceae bacterium]
MISLAKTPIRPDSSAKDIRAAAKAATAEVLSRSSLDALLNVRPEDIITVKAEAEVVKGTAYQPGGWLHAPAQLELFAAADKRLTRVAALGGLNVKRVERVIPMLVKSTSLLVLKAAPMTDLTALPVNRYKGTSSAWANVISLLSEAGLTVETGYRERFEVAYVPAGSPLWPGLVIDLSQPKERRREPKKRKKQPQPESGQPEPTQPEPTQPEPTQPVIAQNQPKTST